MRNLKRYEKQPLRLPVNPGVVALVGLMAAVICFLAFAFDLQLILEIDINGLIVSFVLCGLGAGLGFFLFNRLFPGRPPMSLFGKTGVRIQHQIPFATPAPTVREGPTIVEAHSRTEGLVIPDSYHPQRVSRYKTPENGVIFAFISMILMSAALSPRMPIGWKFLSLSLLAGSVLALIFYWSRWRGRGSNGLNYAVPVAGGAVAAAAMIGLGMVMTRFSFLRIFLELVLGAGAVIAVALHWLHSRPRDTSLV
jgi:hypothetical protein